MENCPVCFGKAGAVYTIKEMMFGTKDEYLYRECDNCGTLYTIGATNILNEYPQDYYSFSKLEVPRSSFKDLIYKKEVKYLINRKNLLGYIFFKLRPIRLPRWLGECNLKNLNVRILDVGCGNGDLLINLKKIGFLSLCGIDPYLPSDIELDGITLKKKEITSIVEKYDLIMFHHSFEHLDNPAIILQSVKHILSENGRVVIRMPVKDCIAWEEYGSNWVQLDAPRHKVLFTRESFAKICQILGFNTVCAYSDSYEFQFWGSEQYKAGIPLNAPNSYSVTKQNSIFSEHDIEKFKEKSAEANKINRGDQAVFILERSE